MNILFVQLPEQDPSSFGLSPSQPLFAASLAGQARQSGQLRAEEYAFIDQRCSDYGGDCAVMLALLKPDLDAIFFTLYDYNRERSMHLARQARKKLSGTSLVALGPEASPDTDLAHTRVFDAILEVAPDWDWRGCAYPYAAGFLELLADLRGRSLKPRYALQSSSSDSADYRKVDPYLNGALAYRADKPVYAGLPAIDILPPAGVQPQLVQAAPLLLRQAGANNIKELVLANPGLSNREAETSFLKSLAAANDSGVQVFMEWPAGRLDEEQAKLLVDLNLVALHSQLLTTNPNTLHILGQPDSNANIERSANLVWTQSAALKLSLYLGLPDDTYDSVIESFDFLGMSGLGQDTELKPLRLNPLTVCRKQAQDFGILDFLALPPYLVTGTATMEEDDFLDALGDFEESFDMAINPPVRPCLVSDWHGFTACADIRTKPALDRLLLRPEALANSVSLLIDADNPELIQRLCAMAPDLRKDNQYILWQLVLFSDKSIPGEAVVRQLGEAFSMTEHYFELAHLYSLDPQSTWQTRLFFATSSEALAQRALYEVRELETIYMLGDRLPGPKLLELTPFIAFNKEKLGFEQLYDLMNAYRNFQDLLLETDL